MKKIILLILFSLLLSACSTPAAVINSPVAPTATEPPLVNTPVPTPTAAAVVNTPEPTPEPLPTEPPVFVDPMPQMLVFQSSDGEVLEGVFYPGAAQNAPLVVLMHWAPGDQGEWAAIAPWLQNQGLLPEAAAMPWLDPSWFPAMPEGRSYAVFTFTFRGCLGGCSSFDREAWLEDARAAMEFAVTLPGVDPQRVVAMGASIGADGALDGCLWLNEKGSGTCLGALSFSPGDYLTLPYAGTAKALAELGYPAWCFYAENDPESARACQPVETSDLLQVFPYPGSDHGMMLFRPEVDPSVMGKMIEFLDLYLK